MPFLFARSKRLYMTTPELLAIRCGGRVSSVAQVCGEWFVTYGPQLSSLLTNGASDGRALHLTLGVDDLRDRPVSECSSTVDASAVQRLAGPGSGNPSASAKRALHTAGYSHIPHQRCPQSTGKHRRIASRAWIV